MWEIFDNYCWDKQKKVITQREHHVPGLGNFAYWNFSTSMSPSPLHIHSNIIEIHCMLKGKRYTQIEKDGKVTKYTVTGNQAMMVFPFEIHSNGSEPMAPCEFYAFQIDVSDPDHLLGLNVDYSRALYKILTDLKYHQVTFAWTHINYLRSAFNFFSGLKPDEIRIGVQFLTTFLFTLPFLQPVREHQATKIDDGLQRSIDYVNHNLNKNIRLIDLAETSGYSLSRFKFKFRTEIGITPSEYIVLQKMEEAKRQLTETDISITVLAYALGFSSSNYFSSVFKKINSCTPKDYRKHYLKNHGSF